MDRNPHMSLKLSLSYSYCRTRDAHRAASVRLCLHGFLAWSSRSSVCRFGGGSSRSDQPSAWRAASPQ